MPCLSLRLGYWELVARGRFYDVELTPGGRQRVPKEQVFGREKLLILEGFEFNKRYMTVHGLDHRSGIMKPANAFPAIGITAGVVISKSANRRTVGRWIGVVFIRLPLDITH